ncbi:MAG: FAD-binding protein, partial [Eubacteriales bacterium]
PYNDYGEFAGYRTDHDTRTRATSCGPLTSKYMTEALERSVREHGVPVFDGYRVIKALTDGEKITGLAAVSPDEKTNRYGLAIFRAENYVFATGGPSAIYSATVYPESQTCSHGVLLEAGAPAVNVTESQYGIASVKFRWNLSGTYQQALPRYFSANEDGSDEREFLTDMFPDPKKLLTAIFRKGYQWPFDPAKLDSRSGNESSLIDIAVYREKMKSRRVFLDFRRNPSCFDISLLEDEPKRYLENSGGLRDTPIERLAAMNPPAIELYRSHGIDLYSEPLEVDICAQHNNGGFEVDTDYRSTGFENLYVIGEAAGVFGVHRPGGSALNSTQVGSRRAAEAILASDEKMLPLPENIRIPCVPTGSEKHSSPDLLRILEKRLSYSRRMSYCGAFIRNVNDIRAAIPEIRAELELFDSYQADSPETLRELSINRDILLTQL